MFEGFYLNIERVKNENGLGFLPTRAHDNDAGMDLYTPMDFIVPARGDCCIPLNIKYEMSDGFVFLIEEKSGIATKKHCDIGAKVCDAGYEGIVHIHLFNNSDIDIEFKRGEKVAQALIIPIWSGHPNEVKAINSKSSRGEGGFGSTGK